MIKKAATLNVQERKAMMGGPGSADFMSIASPEELLNKGRVYSKISLQPGCGIGYHVHEKETEIFYIIKGNPTYNDNGSEIQVSQGDVAICMPGQGHSVTNNSNESAELIALIIME